MTKNVSILGSTGSIGTQALEVIENTGGINVVALSTYRRTDILIEQIKKFEPEIVAVVDRESCYRLRKKMPDCKTKILSGARGLMAAATAEGADTVLNALVGNAGIMPTLRAIQCGKNIIIANKETLVSAGELVIKSARRFGSLIIPIDSEHSAIFQCLQGNIANSVEKIILTGSGGPFRSLNHEKLKNVTPDQALNHPNWKMGPKVTIDSATLMNKGLEMLEAMTLFRVGLKDINIVIHPQSVIHSAVQFKDGAIIAQLGMPDMRVPIQYALYYPKRPENNYERFDFIKQASLTFEEPNHEDFKCLGLAFKAAEIGGTMPAVLNAANEVAVNRFLKCDIGFLDIPKIIERTMDAYTVKEKYTAEELMMADSWAREFAIKAML